MPNLRRFGIPILRYNLRYNEYIKSNITVSYVYYTETCFKRCVTQDQLVIQTR